MKMRRLSVTALTAAAALLLAGCGDAEDGDTGGAGHTGSVDVSVLAAFYPLQFVAERVGGERVVIENLTKPGAEPHDLELTPQQVAAVDEADLVLYIEGFQPAVDNAVEQGPPEHALEVSTVVSFIETGAMDDHGHGDEGHAGEEEHADEGEHAEEHEGDTAGDPHIWLDPTRLAEVATAVGDELADIDPDGADDYQANAEELVTELEALDTEFTEGLSGCERTAFVTSHSAFGYLADAYGLEQVGISGLSPEVEPSPTRIAEVQEVVQDEGVTTIFYETLVSPDLAETMAADLGVETAVLDPLEGLTDASPGEHYFGVMRANLAALRQANGCP